MMLRLACSCVLLCFVAAIVCFGARSVRADELKVRMVIGTDVVCRAQPSSSARAETRLRLGDYLGISKEIRAGGATWYFDEWHVRGLNPTCWVYGPMTTEFDRSNPEPALLALVDHMLRRKDRVAFAEYVEAENLLLDPRYLPVLRSSGFLQFRRLAIIDRAAHSGDGPRLGYDDPLKRAWARGHTDMLREFEPAGHWYVPSEMYWNLYDRYKDAPWADELAWAAAQATQPGDECYTNCHLGMIVAGPLQYWTRLPRGAAIGQALREAIARAGYAMQKSSYETPERGLLDQIRNSLSSVTAPEKSRLLELLDEAQRKIPPR